MELRHLETLLAIDTEGSFTGAADALGQVEVGSVGRRHSQRQRDDGAQAMHGMTGAHGHGERGC